jgi:phospholipid/cholesterol/gamma-HCH transport system substrate-binding protein
VDRSPVRDFIVGLFVLAGFAALAYLSISIGGFDWHPRGKLKITATFGEIGDLSVRAPVTIGGVRVGQVSNITLNKDFRAVVVMDLNSDLQLDSETNAAIVTSGMIGDKYIELSPGNSDKILKSGDVMSSTTDAITLEKLIGQFIYGVTKSSGDNSSQTKPATASQPASRP